MYKVMIVDDMEAIRLQLKRLPVWGEVSGFRIVAEAANGKQALDKLKQDSIDLLITDIRMPVIDGLELLREVRQSYPELIVVFLSDHGEFAIAQEAIQYGLADYLIKPVDREALSRFLAKARERLSGRERSRREHELLEGQLLEKLDVLYPREQVGRLVELICQGNPAAQEEIGFLAAEILAMVNGDEMKAEVIRKKAQLDIMETVLRTNAWLLDFVVQSPGESFEEKVRKVLEITARLFPAAWKNPYVLKLCQVIVEDVDEDLTMEMLASRLYLSKNYVGELFKDVTGCTIGEYVAMVKVERAKKLIRSDSLRLYEIAEMLGYRNVEYFTKVFKKHAGLTPKEYRQLVSNR